MGDGRQEDGLCLLKKYPKIVSMFYELSVDDKDRVFKDDIYYGSFKVNSEPFWGLPEI